jgi:hypothetical protein
MPTPQHQPSGGFPSLPSVRTGSTPDGHGVGNGLTYVYFDKTTGESLTSPFGTTEKRHSTLMGVSHCRKHWLKLKPQSINKHTIDDAEYAFGETNPSISN